MNTLPNEKSPVSPTDVKFKKWLIDHLNFGVVKVLFTKKDGSERSMLCTTSKDLLPIVESSEIKPERKTNENILPVFDIEARAWRSFRWDSIKFVTFSLGEFVGSTGQEWREVLENVDSKRTIRLEYKDSDGEWKRWTP